MDLSKYFLILLMVLLVACNHHDSQSNEAPPGIQQGIATLQWDPDPAPNLAGYKVYQSTVSQNYGAPLATVGASTTTYTDTTGYVGTKYYFVVTAFDSFGNESLHSNEVEKVY